LRGGLAVAQKAKCAEIVEVALTTAFGYRPNVVGIPEAAPRGDGLHTVQSKTSGAGGASGSLESAVSGKGVDRTDGTDAAVTREDPVAEVAGVGAQTPLMNAVVAAKGAAPFGDDLKIAPPAEGQIVGADWQILAYGATAGEGTRDEHGLSSIGLRGSVRDC
jgi:hypothetical protein